MLRKSHADNMINRMSVFRDKKAFETDPNCIYGAFFDRDDGRLYLRVYTEPNAEKHI